MDESFPVETCPVCQERFKVTRHWKKYCSAKCRMRAWQIKQIDIALAEVRQRLVKKIKEAG
jgi:hypothetical protein